MWRCEQIHVELEFLNTVCEAALFSLRNEDFRLINETVSPEGTSFRQGEERFVFEDKSPRANLPREEAES